MSFPATIRGVFVACLSLGAIACQSTAPVPPPAPAAAVSAAPVKVSPTKTIPAVKPSVERLTFKVDSASSRGHILTTLDPYGLGPRISECNCPLHGTVHAKLTIRADGTRSLALETIEIANTEEARFKYDWSPLIGKINTTIPSGNLTISRHTIAGPLALDRAGNFRRGGNRFKVGGIASVEGKGLFLKKRVGNTESDLGIDRTEEVDLAGTLVRRNGSWVLHVPKAILRDRFDLDENGSTMDLSFTADITAVAE